MAACTSSPIQSIRRCGATSVRETRTLILVVKECLNVRSCKPSTLCDLHNDERIFQAVLAVIVAALEVEGIDELQIETALKPTTASKEDLRFLADSVDSLGLYTPDRHRGFKTIRKLRPAVRMSSSLERSIRDRCRCWSNWVSILDNFELTRVDRATFETICQQ